MESKKVDGSNGSNGIEENDKIVMQFKSWMLKTNETMEKRRIKRKQQLKEVKTELNEQVVAIHGYLKKFGKKLGGFLSSGVDTTTNTMNSGIIILSNSVDSMIYGSESFVRWLFMVPRKDDLGKTEDIRPVGADISEFSRYLDEAKQNIVFSEEKWCIFVSLTGRKLEIVLQKLLEDQTIDIEEHIDMFKLLKLAEVDNLLDSEQLDILHLFRKSRNDLIHGRTNELNSNLIILAAHIVLDLENYANRDINDLSGQ